MAYKERERRPPPPGTLLARDYEYGDMKIPRDALLGVTWTDSFYKRKVVTTGEFLPDGRRIARLKLSSYTEMGSAGASHWYAKIEAFVQARHEGSNMTSGGYIHDAPYDDVADSIDIRVHKKLKKLTKDAWGRVVGKRGDITTRIETKEEARELAIKTFLERFGPGWALVESPDYDEEVIVATTEEHP